MYITEDERLEALDTIRGITRALHTASLALQVLPAVVEEMEYWKHEHAKLVQEDIETSGQTTVSILHLILEGKLKV